MRDGGRGRSIGPREGGDKGEGDERGNFREVRL